MLPPVVQFTWEDHYLQSCSRMESVATLSFFKILQAHPISLEPDLTRILKLYTCGLLDTLSKMYASFLLNHLPACVSHTNFLGVSFSPPVL